MSNKIEQGLKDLTEISTKRGEDRQAFLNRLVEEINALDDKDFGSLDADQSKWFNAACDAIEAEKDIPEPDAAEEKPAAGRRRAAAAETPKEEGPYEPAVDDEVKLVTKRGKEATGVVVEVNDENIAIDTGAGVEDFPRNRLESIEPISASKSSKSDNEPADPLTVGAEIEFTTKRGKVVKGKITEIDGDTIVIDDEEYLKERIDLDTIKAVGTAPAATRRGGASATKDEKPKPAAKSAKPAAASATGRMRELLVESLKADGKLLSKEKLDKSAKAENLDYKPATLDLVYSELDRLIDLLDKAGLLNLK